MTIRRTYRRIILPLVMAIAVSCDNSYDIEFAPDGTFQSVELSLSDKVFHVDAKGGEVNVTVNFNDDVAINIPAADWITCSQSLNTYSSRTTRLVVAPNSSLESRTGEVIFKSVNKSESDTVTVVQQGVIATLALSQTTFSPCCYPENLTIAVTTNVAWSAVSDAEWCTVSPATGSGNGNLTLSAIINTAQTDRTATVTVTAADKSIDIAVTQQASDTEYVPFTDAGFKTFVLESFDTDHNGKIDIDEAKRVETIDIPKENYSIKSMDDIRYFPNLRYLCYEKSGEEKGDIERLDLSNNKELDVVIFDNQSITNVVFGNLPNLNHLNLCGNYLSEIDISGCTYLSTIIVSDNLLHTLDVSKQSRLTNLQCQINNLNSLDVGANHRLEFLYFGDNIDNISLLDCPNLKNVYVLNATMLEQIDLSENMALSDIYITNSRIKEIDLTNNINLKSLSVSSCPYISQVDLSHNLMLERVVITICDLESIDLSHNTAVTHLELNNNRITELDLSHTPNLNFLNCCQNLLQTLDCSVTPNIATVSCTSNPSLTRLLLNAGQTVQELHKDSQTLIEYK